MKTGFWAVLGIACVLLLAQADSLPAQTTQGNASSSTAEMPTEAAKKSKALEDEFDAALAASLQAGVKGPATIPLLAQGEMALPEGYLFVPKAEASRLMRAMGNSAPDSMLGLVIGEANWFATIRFIDSGFIRDDDAKTWDADALLQEIIQGTEEANKERVERGFLAFHVAGWIEKPTYNADRHQLVWSIAGTEDNQPVMESTVNYNTFALGREGYFDLSLVTSTASVAKDKADAARLLDALHFVDGKKYADFDESTDAVAAYGLAALVAGVGAKKLGLIAIVVGFLAKFAHVIAVGVAIAAAGVFRWFKSRWGEGAA